MQKKKNGKILEYTLVIIFTILIAIAINIIFRKPWFSSILPLTGIIFGVICREIYNKKKEKK